MADATIQCPNCLRTYSVAESIIGKKVVCTDPVCGQRFIAKAEKPESAEIEEIDGPELVPLSPSKERCLYGFLGRMLLGCGCLFLLAGMVCPTTKYRQLSGEWNYYYNEPLAAHKHSALLVAIALMASGSIILARSAKPLTHQDAGVATVVIAIALLVLLVQSIGVMSVL